MVPASQVAPDELQTMDTNFGAPAAADAADDDGGPIADAEEYFLFLGARKGGQVFISHTRAHCRS